MNHYEQRIADKTDAMTERADRMRAEGEARLSATKRATEHLPLGQNFPSLSRINASEAIGFATVAAANKLNARAANLGKHAISSDDPDAVDKLRTKLASLEKTLDVAKLTNQLVRKKDRAGLMTTLNYTHEQVDALMTRTYGEIGIPSYVITNLSANIRRIHDRIEAIEKTNAKPPFKDVVGDGFRLYEDAEMNRFYIEFDEKPDEAMRAQLRGAGFKWTPSRGVWGRQRNESALYAAKRILTLL